MNERYFLRKNKKVSSSSEIKHSKTENECYDETPACVAQKRKLVMHRSEESKIFMNITI